MAHAQLTAVPRTETGNGPARRLRRQGMVPGILYQPSGAALAFAVPERELRRALISEGGREGVVDLRIGDGPVQATRLADWHRDPVRGDILHIDLRPVDEAEVAQVAAEQAEAERVALQAAAEAEAAGESRGADVFEEPDAADAE
ncbi:MAG TPA: hypothetical protein VNT51_05305 [Miltoncostaeaceae bacterium]|nr:hypothetical protein [Miltoncostaeaceae bacterium]